MNKLSLKLVNASNYKPTIMIDNKPVKFVKNKYGSYEIEYSTQKSSAKVCVYRFLELSGKLWLLMSLLFFIISVFGIFDVPYSKNYMVLDCEFEIPLQEQTNVKFVFNNPNKSDKAIQVESESNVKEIKNIFYEDKKVKKRVKVVNIIKFVLYVAIAVGLSVLVANVIGV